MTNKELSKIFYEMAELLEMEEVQFKPRAYEKAGQALEVLEEDVVDIYREGGLRALEGIPSVGKGIAERIEEHIKTGHIKDYDKLKKKVPVNVSELTAIEGVGPKLTKLFYKKLGVKNLTDLEKKAKAGKLAKLPRSGKKLEQKILKGIKFYKRSSERFLLAEVHPLVKKLERRLSKVEGVEKISFCGSFRRRKETIGDLDILVSCSSTDSGRVMDYFISMPEVEHVYAKGATKSSVRLGIGMDADLRIVEEKSFGAASQYFTGSKAHNIALRKIAIKKGYKLNEYGIFKGKKYIAGKTEEEVYEKLGLQWIPPEIRENNDEIELAQKKKLPKLIEEKDIKGDLQVHTTWSDGVNSIEEMAKKVQWLGYEYVLITDHTRGGLSVAGGLHEGGFAKQKEEIDEVNEKLKIKILCGAEVNIMKDGSLDMDDEVLAKLDIVGAAVHSHFHLPKEEQTARMIKVMGNPHIDIILHPTTRMLKRRPEIDLDMDKIFEAAELTGTILEISAWPERLDINDVYIRKAREVGVKFMINTDSHSVSHLDFMKFGVGQARRGWCEKGDVVNTLPLDKLIALFKKPKEKRF